MNQNHQEIYDQEDKVLLKHVLLFLFNSKWIILGITSLITTISIVYVLSITPIYHAHISVYPPSDLSISKINNFRFKDKVALPDSVNFQKKVFMKCFYIKFHQIPS